MGDPVSPNICRESGEIKADFIKRIADYVNWEIPKEIDFSKVVNNDKSKYM